MEEIRLNKYLASCGICSRRDADKLIEQGLVAVNGKTASQGMKITEGDEVSVRGRKVAGRDKKVVLAYYKPVGVVCTERDAHAEKIVTDKDSEGLLLMTNDGDLIEAMMRGANRHEKEYLVKVRETWTEEAIQRLRAGVYLEELDVTTRPCAVERTGPKTVRMVLTQGLNRQIRRMCRAQGYHILSLKRTRVVNIELGGLRPGEYRELSAGERKDLYRICGLTANQ